PDAADALDVRLQIPCGPQDTRVIVPVEPQRRRDAAFHERSCLLDGREADVRLLADQGPGRDGREQAGQAQQHRRSANGHRTGSPLGVVPLSYWYRSLQSKDDDPARCLRQRPDRGDVSRRHGKPLPSAGNVADDAATERAIEAGGPETSAAAGVERIECSADVTEEHDAA